MKGHDIERILGALSGAGVRYLVVGGVAVVLHGHLRVTRDVDLVVELVPANVRTALKALSGLGFRPRAPVRMEDFADPEQRRGWVRDKNMRVFSLWNSKMPLTEVDLFVEEPLDFQAAWARAVQARIGSFSVPVAGLEDLIALKRVAGRPQDVADIDALERLHAGPDDDGE